MSNLFSRLFGPRAPRKTAEIARERLMVVVARERDKRSNQPDFLPALQKELVEVISKYVSIRPEDIKVKLDRQDDYEMLEVNIVLPENR